MNAFELGTTLFDWMLPLFPKICFCQLYIGSNVNTLYRFHIIILSASLCLSFFFYHSHHEFYFCHHHHFANRQIQFSQRCTNRICHKVLLFIYTLVYKSYSIFVSDCNFHKAEKGIKKKYRAYKRHRRDTEQKNIYENGRANTHTRAKNLYEKIE